MSHNESAITRHEPVMLQEVIQGLAITRADVVFDGTAGGGGHSEAIAMLLGAEGTLIACDLSETALERVKSKLETDQTEHPKFHFVQSNFRSLTSILNDLGVKRVNKVIFDLGLSSDELEISGRGFSFRNLDEPILMTYMDAPTDDDVTAQVILNTWSESTIADVIYGFGGERKSRGIAKAIVRAREEKPFKTVGDLVSLIEATCGRSGKIHPATKTFQALRIAVNDETGSLTDGIQGALAKLETGGRLAIISFESITDRIVKRAFLAAAQEEIGIVITKKPQTPAPLEISRNPRARSAKLRIFEKL